MLTWPQSRRQGGGFIWRDLGAERECSRVFVESKAVSGIAPEKNVRRENLVEANLMATVVGG